MRGFYLLLLLCSFSVFLPSIILSSNEVASNETDLSALISFKEAISFGALSLWNDSLHHCLWQGVRCGRRHPDRVTAISLGSFNLSGRISSSLANLTFLKSLNLSHNQLSGDIPIELGRLNRLQFLNLSENNLDGNIPSTLGNCSNLEFLHLSVNNLQGIIPSSLVQCRNLRHVTFGNNFLVGGIPPEFGFLDQLKVLIFARNNLSGPIPHTLSNLTHLTYLYLYGNSLTGSIPSSLGQLKALEYLILSQNYLSGKIPHSIYNLSVIAEFNLGHNQLEGDLPSNFCDVFPNLLYLSLYKNQLNGQIPISISNCSAILVIELASNNFGGTIPDNIGSLQNLFWFSIAQNQIKATHGVWRFLDSLINCTLLQLLSLEYNQLQGMIPTSVGNLSTSLHHLGLALNPISGSIPAEIGKLTNLQTLDLGKTFIEGTIPKEIGNLKNLGWLDLSSNKFSGEIPSTFGNLTQMNELHLENNAFTGSIPMELSNMRVLNALNLSNNKLTGSIPQKIFSLRSLSISLDLSNNYLIGSLPIEIGKLENIVQVYLSNKKLSGQIPSTIADCLLLQILHLEGNQLIGPIPFSLSNMIGLLDLDISNNALSGPVPDFIGQMKLEHLNISFNNFEGQLPKDGIFKNVSAIDVRRNSKLCGGLAEMHLPKCILSNQKKKHHSQSTTVILCCICGIICLCITMCLIAHFYWKKRSQNNPQQIVEIKSEYQKVSYNDILRATDHFSLENLIGRGTFGAVYKAPMRFENVTTVAVKVLNLEQHGASRSFLSECEVLREVRHKNLIKVLSACSSTDHHGKDFKALIFEFMPNGSLEAWLHPTACTNRPFRSLSLIQRLNIAIEIATALDYLHNHGPTPIVHCDLKPSNVLLNDDMTALVGDFGLARFLVQSDSLSSLLTTSTVGIKGSIGYIPPEYGMGSQASVEGDVYSYGILLLEMFTGVSPIDERFKDGLSLQEHVEMAFYNHHVIDIIDHKLFSDNGGGESAYVSKDVHDCLVLVIQCGLSCSKLSPKERIGIKEVVNELNSARVKLLRYTTKDGAGQDQAESSTFHL